MRTLFVGGPGRSGTSYVASRLGGHPQICAFPEIELKLFTEKNGLLDLYHALCATYSPNRGTVAMQQFRRMVQALIDGQYGQPALDVADPRVDLAAIFDRFCATLEIEGHPRQVSESRFFDAANTLLHALAGAAASTGCAAPTLFLEKTPHALLSMDFLERIAPGADYLHIMRDPRSIAQSLRQMRWGPGTLQACCAWVESYCLAWRKTRIDAELQGRHLRCLSIEAIAGAPHDAAGDLLGWLSLDPCPDLFVTARQETLNGWAAVCPDDERRMLDDRLGGWAEVFGYRVAEIGVPATVSEPA